MILPLGPIGPNILDISMLSLGLPLLVSQSTLLSLDASLNLDLKALFDARAVETLSRDRLRALEGRSSEAA